MVSPVTRMPLKGSSVAQLSASDRLFPDALSELAIEGGFSVG
jgi:hypothetical protein